MIGISSCGEAFLVSKFLIHFAITYVSAGTKENSVGFLKYCFILKMLGSLLYFLLHATTDQFHFPYHKRCSHLFQCLMCSQCYQKTSWKFQLFLDICQNFSTFNKCYFVVLRPIFFSEKWRYCFLEQLIISNTTKV